MKASAKIAAFKNELLAWYAKNKRDLPFRGEKDPYRIWVSEVLLQQTQMSRGVEYYVRFIERFPTVRSLSEASWEEFLPYFRGLGFYTRGRNMLKAAKVVVEEYGGRFPDDFSLLITIPGVGPYTAHAILSFAYGRPVLTRDTNVNRILERVFYVKGGKHPSPLVPLGVLPFSKGRKSEEASLVSPPVEKEVDSRVKRAKTKDFFIPSSYLPKANLTGLAQIIERSLSAEESSDLNQAMMDLGSAVCLSRAPRCAECPLRDSCSYAATSSGGRPSFTEVSAGRRPALVKVQRPAQSYQTKHPIALIHHEGNVLLPGGRLLSGSLGAGDERPFLKALAEKQLGLEISVRPAVLTWVQDGVRYSAHRCRILSGAPHPEWPMTDPPAVASAKAISSLL